MVGPSKILTVSYGTFSCTLEGFDEPFVMMKAVAEYFRDLAAEDRYFGAEPPKPDEVMLQRIAEREIQRRVEAKVGEHGVTLRQGEPVTAPALVPTPPQVVEPAAAAEIAPQAAEAHVPEAMVETVVAPAELAPGEPEEPVAAAIEQQEAAPIEAPAETPVAEIIEEDAKAVAFAEEPSAEFAEEPAAPIADAAYDLPQDESEPVEAPTIAAGALPSVSAEIIGQGHAAHPAQDEPDSIAAKLKRIRAVVDSVRATQQTDDSEDSDVLPTLTEAVPLGIGFPLDTSADAPDLVAAEAARAAERSPAADAGMDFDDEDEPISDGGTDMLRASFLDDEEEGGPAALDEDADLRARIAALGHQAAASDDVTPPVEAVRETAPEPPPASDRFALDTEEEQDWQEAEAEPQPSFFQRARARVVRIGKHALGRGNDRDQEGAEAWADDAAPVGAVADDAGDGSLDENMDRLMEEARMKLDGVENRRRFNAISHLKAAVAATLADRQMQDGKTEAEADEDEEGGIDLYREDLSKAVRPRRTVSGRPLTERPQMATPPLVLVSEQRVDVGPASYRDLSIRPRRIAGNAVAAAADDEEDWADEEDLSPESAANFAEFADRLGAHSLTELLEAAAVYTASIEGQPYFSRPHLLRKVQFVSSRGDYNREDGLRSFGTLLREGKILKISRGQFAVAEASRYMIETRRAAH